MSNQLTTPQQKHMTFKSFVESDRLAAELSKALPAHMTPSRMVRVALTAAMKQPLLLECTQASVASALLNCSEMGLEPNGRDCHLIPFKNKGKYEVQVIPDYKGLIKLAYNSGLVTKIIGQAVRKGDAFEYHFGTGGYVRHRPAEERGELTHAWALAELTGKGEVFVVLDRKKVMAHKSKSRSASSEFSPWNDPDFEDAMWAKTAVRELSKFIPSSPQMSTALQLDDEADLGKSQVVPVFDSAGTHTADLMGELAEDLSPSELCADEPFSKSEQLASQMAGKR